jgi:hypothetical protein
MAAACAAAIHVSGGMWGLAQCAGLILDVGRHTLAAAVSTDGIDLVLRPDGALGLVDEGGGLLDVTGLGDGKDDRPPAAAAEPSALASMTASVHSAEPPPMGLSEAGAEDEESDDELPPQAARARVAAAMADMARSRVRVVMNPI